MNLDTSNTSLYFAYGSNLNKHDWKNWCAHYGHNPKSIQPLFPAWLPDHCVRFTHYSRTRQSGVLDIIPAVGCVVPGMVFQVSLEGWAALNEKEGAPHAYRRVAQQCLDFNGNPHQVYTYEVNENKRKRFVPPSTKYLDIVKQGLEAYELPSTHIDAADQNAPPKPLEAVFVYGTLLRGESRHHLLGKLDCALLAETYGTLVDCGEYPALCLPDSTASSDFVQGEFVRLRNPARLLKLDAIEGFVGFGKIGSLFRRTLIDVGMRDGRVRQAWTYVGDSALNDALREIPSGDWREDRGIKTTFLSKLAEAHCVYGEHATASKLVNSSPFPVENEAAEIEFLLPLADALASGRISERQLAQASGQWNVNPAGFGA